MFLLSVTGTVRMILIIIAVFVIIRFIGRLLMAKNSLKDEKRYHQNNESYRKAKAKSEQEKGKIHIVDGRYRDAEDVSFEEVKDENKNE